MMRTPLKNFFLFLTAAPVLIADVVAMDNTQSFNQVANRLTERIAVNAYNQTPDQNILVSAVGPTIQLLETSQSLCHLDNEDSAESAIKREIYEGLGITKSTDVENLVDDGYSLNSRAVTGAHLHMIPQGPDFLRLGLAQPSSSNVIAANLDKPEEAADIANNWVKKQTRGGITKIADAEDFRPTISQRMTHVFLSALFVKAKWGHPCHKTIMNFHSKNALKRVQGFTHTDNGYIYESPAHLANPFKILNLIASDNIYLAIKMYDNGSVSPITVKEFNEPAAPYRVNFKIPFFNFSTQLDLIKSVSSLFPTLFSTPYQTTWADEPAATLVFRQKNFIDVDEVGIKAGSATMKADYALAGGWGPVYNIEIDKPFSFLLFQKTHGSISNGENYIHLFSGTVVDLPALPNPNDVKVETSPIKAEKTETTPHRMEVETKPIRMEKVEETPRKVEAEAHYTEIKMSLALLESKLTILEKTATDLTKEMAGIRAKYEAFQQK